MSLASPVGFCNGQAADDELPRLSFFMGESERKKGRGLNLSPRDQQKCGFRADRNAASFFRQIPFLPLTLQLRCGQHARFLHRAAVVEFPYWHSRFS
jgi:hypothetical protein